MFKEFHEQSSFLKSLNNTFLVLIPKKGGAADLGDFRPISLLGGLYKLMAKVLANRLKRVLNKVKRKEKGLICKLDIEKAYDSINWHWFFPSSKGLRQGDPLSPYLFVLGMEVLDALIRGRLRGLPFRAPNTFELDSLWFEAASGLRINLDKSEIIPVGVVEEIEEMAVELGCRWERKAHLIKWEAICEDKSKGGLGLRKLVFLNKALLGKWIWRFAYDKDDLWKQVITAKYGQEGHGWRAKRAYGAIGGGYKAVPKLPHLYAMASHRNATVEEMELAACLRDYKPSMEEDSVCWKGGRNGKFRVKEAYRLVTRPNDIVFPSRCIWVDSVPTKVAFYAWEATWGRVLTLDRLQKRGWQFPNCCFLCGCEEETVNHILIHCIVVRVCGILFLGYQMCSGSFQKLQRRF
ncbi:hypothetical protein CK203_066328 [Vitis vinifera]|uniref:Uncharacterized protein n=1 Tax=Vitis vinifera TaxID=29760 RepID=A0A438G2H3_VITVI|nr:hypothetical protein CK203_066328 [Vitis vinifera]